MKILGYLIRRNTKLFFKDRGVFFTSLIAPLVLLLLFITFLGNVYRDSFHACTPENITVPQTLVDGFVGGWLFSSLLAVCCVTVAFSANMIMVQDRVTGAVWDLTIAPVRRITLSLSYYISTAFITAIICYITAGVGFLYLAAIGWYLTVTDVFLVLSDVFLLVMFGTALSSVICYFLKSQGGITAVTTIVSAAYGFLCGAYMPIHSFSTAVCHFITMLPGTYGTVLLHNHLMRGCLNTLEESYFPKEVVDGIRESFDNRLTFFDHDVPDSVMYLVLVGAVCLLILLYVLLGMRKKRRAK